MGDRGLNTSIWATRGTENTTFVTRHGDWECPLCGFSNFQFRTECLRCSTGTASRSGSPAVNGIERQLSKLQNGNGLGDQHVVSEKSLQPSPTRTPPYAPAPIRLERGLATSRWATRNRTKNTDSGQIWIRTAPKTYVAPDDEVLDTNSAPLIPTPPDLGLPYEVQHFILAMIQRILEEGCYDFTYRWIPATLFKKNWNCAEAVELSTWRDFLPNALPLNAIVPVPRYSLQQALKDAVNIRNAAVHRHLCDNTEIRRMSQQAQYLMIMFSDITRQNKFYRLEEELKDWDNWGNQNPEAARTKLELALQEIDERPLDDMDWTPNAVSLEEIKSNVAQIQDSKDYEDAMELD